MSKVDIGGNRLGSGGKTNVELGNYQRSTHDLSYLWRSTMASGTLIPFMSEVALPGDNFEIKLNCNIMTHPTIGPLFGSYKVQLDVFQVPVRLYNGKLHMNALNIGMNMSNIKLPQIELRADGTNAGDNTQINPSAIFSHLNIRGLGKRTGGTREGVEVKRKFNAVPYLAYWDIYKQYYANKQEEIGAVIHNNQNEFVNRINAFNCMSANGIVIGSIEEYDMGGDTIGVPSGLQIFFDSVGEYVNENDIYITLRNTSTLLLEDVKITALFNLVTNATNFAAQIDCGQPNGVVWDHYITNGAFVTHGWKNKTVLVNDEVPRIKTFPLVNIDMMREQILTQTLNSGGGILINHDSIEPYSLPLQKGDSGKYSMQSTQEGLALKTYQSDLFNNWIQTEWIDGSNGINEISAVDVSDGMLKMDALVLARKVYDMLNKIAITDGTYSSWMEAVYGHNSTRVIENPVYLGGLSRELGFQEVVSNASSNNGGTEQPLGTLAGRGVMTKKNKGGYIDVRVDEPSYIIGIISLTPRIDYSQGNKWDVNLKTMDDFHKPSLDEIGYQDSLTDQRAYWDTDIDQLNNPIFKSAGKVPAWINYMTNVNVCRGNFAEENEQMFMTLNRRFEKNSIGNIKDLTTYIDPSKFNNIFADTRLDAQNFWSQISIDMNVRRKMSAKIMPNL